MSGVLEVTVVTPAVSVIAREMSGSPNAALGMVVKLITVVGMAMAPEDSATPKTIKMAEMKAVITLVIGFIGQA